MKEVKHYVCDICHTEYNDKNKCKQCEEHHCKVKEFKGARYISFDGNNKGCPVSIDVLMEDGKTITFKR